MPRTRVDYGQGRGKLTTQKVLEDVAFPFPRCCWYAENSPFCSFSTAGTLQKPNPPCDIFFFLQISTFCSTVFFPWRGGRCQELPSSCDDTLQEQSEEIPETFIAEAQALASVSEGLCPLSNSCRQLSAGWGGKTCTRFHADVRQREQVVEKGASGAALLGSIHRTV